MTYIRLRKTLLALAVAATSLPAHAQTVQLTNAGFKSENHTYAETLEITGSYSGDNGKVVVDQGSGNAPQPSAPVEIHGSHLQKDLILNASIDSKGDYAGGADLDQAPTTSASPLISRVDGNLVNKGSISATGDGVVSLRIALADIGGSVINEGLLSAKGGPMEGDDVANGMNISSPARIGGDLINSEQGRIIVEGEGASAIDIRGGAIAGKVINRGLIQGTGEDTTGIEFSARYNFGTGNGPRVELVDIAGIENHGTIIARGQNALGIDIGGVSFNGGSDHFINTGTIEGSWAAIYITRYDINVPNVGSLGDLVPLRIINSGTLRSDEQAIDVWTPRGKVYLELEEGSQVIGNLMDLSSIQVNGDTRFTGKTVESRGEGYNIQMKDAARDWVEVGSAQDYPPAQLNLLAPHTRLDGNLYVSYNSAIGLNLSSATNPDVAVFALSGTAEFAQGAQIKLAAQGSDFAANGSVYKLLSAGRIDILADDGITIDPNGKLDLVSSSALLKVDSYSVENNTLVATVTGKGQEEVSEIIGNHGGSANSQKAIGSLVNDGVLNRIREQNPNDPLLQALLNTNEADLTRIAEQLTPETNGGATRAATTSQNLVSNVTGSRTSSLRGASSGEGFKETGVWVQSLYSDATQDLRDGVAGYNAYSRGIAVGADGKLSDDLTLGLAYSFINTDVNGKSGNKTKVDSHAFTLYGGYELGSYFVDGSLTYGLNDNDSKRQIAGTRAKASYDSDLLGLNLVGGYTWKINPQVLVEPRLAARYSLVNIDGYREKGSSAALKVEDQRYEAIELGAGVRVAGSFNLGAGTLEPQVKLMAYHDFAADETSSTSTFLLGNTPFVTSGAKAVRNSYEAGIGTDYKLGAVTLGVNYDYIGKSGFDADVFSAKVRYDF